MEEKSEDGIFEKQFNFPLEKPSDSFPIVDMTRYYTPKYKINMSHTPSAISHPKFKIGDRIRIDVDDRPYIFNSLVNKEGNIQNVIQSKEKLSYMSNIFGMRKTYEYLINRLPCYVIKFDDVGLLSFFPEKNLSLVERVVDGVEEVMIAYYCGGFYDKDSEPECHCKNLLWGHENSCPYYKK